MNHQITLEELGFIPRSQEEHIEPKKQYAFPCGGCICNHCANSVECWYDCNGEMESPCFTCDECINYDGYGRRQNRTDCSSYKITNKYAEYLRKKLKALKKQIPDLVERGTTE